MSQLQQTATATTFGTSFNFSWLLSGVKLSMQRASARRQLLGLNDHLLRDAGLTRTNVMSDLF